MARAWRWTFGLVGLIALALQYVLMWSTPRLDPVQVTLNFFSYFTILTNEDMDRIHALARPDGRLGDWLDAAFKWDEEWA